MAERGRDEPRADVSGALPRTPEPPAGTSKLQAALGTALVGVSLVVMVTCGRQAVSTPPQVAQPPAPSAPASPAEPGVATAEPLTGAGVDAAAPDTPSDAALAPQASPLAHFHAALSELSRGERQGPVRVTWFGDSHTAADFWTDTVRRRLSARFGVGGPGFIYVGLDRYRHASVSIEVDGKWEKLPSQPASSSPLKDPTLGLGGIRTGPTSADARLRLRLREGAVRGRASWSLWYRMPDAASRFMVSLGEEERRVTARRVGEVEQLKLSAAASVPFVLSRHQGRPELLGLTVEGSEPGVVLDTVGINGARAATALAWGRESFVAALRARAPSLVVLAFGTNEAGANTPVERYREHYQAFLERIREAAPETSCALFGPTDWVKGGQTLPRITQIDALQREVAAELSCAYFSAFSEMGGAESALRWSRESPPLAAPDLIHLTPKGYQRLGEGAASLLLP